MCTLCINWCGVDSHCPPKETKLSSIPCGTRSSTISLQGRKESYTCIRTMLHNNKNKSDSKVMPSCLWSKCWSQQNNLCSRNFRLTLICVFFSKCFTPSVVNIYFEQKINSNSFLLRKKLDVKLRKAFNDKIYQKYHLILSVGWNICIWSIWLKRQIFLPSM